MRILIADDNADVTKVCSEYLTLVGFEVVVATDGAAALKVLRESDIDVAVTDVLMPNVDGIEFLLQARGECTTCKIVAMSGNPLYLDNAVGLGADACLAKPFEPAELLEVIKKVSQP